MDLSIVIVNYNTKEITADCLDSLKKNTKGIDCEVIVVDNNSSDGSIPMLRKRAKRKEIILIANNENLGFGKANNMGIKIAKGRYVLLLNSDTIISENILFEMVGWMDSHKNADISTCALKNKDGTYQGTGGSFPDIFRVFAWMFFIEDIPVLDKIIKPYHPMHPVSPIYKGSDSFEQSAQRDWITGAFMLFRSDVFKKIGVFDEDFFMYVEEVELCYRARKKGLSIWYLPKWSITHFGGASGVGKFSLIQEYKGIKLFYKKHLPKWQMPLLRYFLKAGALLRITGYYLAGNREVAEAYAQAYKIA